jgi:hypothetical protein
MSETTQSQIETPERALSVTETSELRVLDPGVVFFARHGARLRLTLDGECSYISVTILRIFPLSFPGQYYSVRDSAGKEISLIRRPTELSEENRRLVEDELRRRYMGSVIVRITSVKDRFGTVEWGVLTDRGPCTFTTRELRETVLNSRPGNYIISDVEGNRFEIQDLSKLDRRSQEILMRRL